MIPELRQAVEAIREECVREYFLNNYDKSLVQQASAESYLMGFLHGMRVLDPCHPVVAQLECVLDIIIGRKE